MCVCVAGGGGGGVRKGCSKVATLFLQVSVQVLSQIPTTHLRKFCENLGIPSDNMVQTNHFQHCKTSCYLKYMIKVTHI